MGLLRLGLVSECRVTKNTAIDTNFPILFFLYFKYNSRKFQDYTNICWYEAEKMVADTKSCLYTSSPTSGTVLRADCCTGCPCPRASRAWTRSLDAERWCSWTSWNWCKIPRKIFSCPYPGVSTCHRSSNGLSIIKRLSLMTWCLDAHLLWSPVRLLDASSEYLSVKMNNSLNVAEHDKFSLPVARKCFFVFLNLCQYLNCFGIESSFLASFASRRILSTASRFSR